jgi:hypothetical protein
MAQAMADLVGAYAGAEQEPVQEMVQEVLAEYHDEDTAIVHAFEEALEEEAAEVSV